MSGHSKWSTIKRKKGALDAARGKVFGRLVKEITIAARQGGASPDGNPRLRTAIATAKAASMPAGNIDRAIKKGSGDADDGSVLEELVYEGYGPAGVAILIDIVTDNKNRTLPEIRHMFTKNGGRMAEAGSVAWQFTTRGVIVIERDQADEDTLIALSLEAGADDVTTEEDSDFEVFTPPTVFEDVRAAIEKSGIAMASAEIRKVPQNTVTIEGKDAEICMKLMDALEDHDDVQKVAANFDISDEVMEQMSQE